MAQRKIDDIRLAGAKLEQHTHICAFFDSRDDEYQVMLPFIKEGIEPGEKAFHIIDPQLEQDHLHRLENAGIHVDKLENPKQLEVRVWESAYLRRDGCFDQEDMLDLIEEILKIGKDEGFPLTRLVAHMEWSLQHRPGVHDLIEYEARLNYILPHYQDPVICIYDIAKFSAGVIIDVLRTHPMVIINGILQENPFYIPADEFLKQLKSRTR
jgi:hypothetical protein